MQSSLKQPRHWNSLHHVPLLGLASDTGYTALDWRRLPQQPWPEFLADVATRATYTPQVPPDYEGETWTVCARDIDDIFARAGLTEAQEWDTRRLLAHARARFDL